MKNGWWNIFICIRNYERVVTIRKEWVTETIGLVLWFGGQSREFQNFKIISSQTSICGKKVLVKDIHAYFKVMIKFSQRNLRDIIPMQCCGRKGCWPPEIPTACCYQVKFATCLRNSQLSFALLSKVKKISRIWTTPFSGCNSQFL